MRRPEQREAPAKSVNVGLYLDERIDTDAADLAALRHVTKSSVYAAGVRRVLDDLTPAERDALAAMRAARTKP